MVALAVFSVKSGQNSPDAQPNNYSLKISCKYSFFNVDKSLPF